MLQWLLFLVLRIEILRRLVKMADPQVTVTAHEIPRFAMSVRPGEIGLVVMAEMDGAVLPHHADAVRHEHGRAVGVGGIGGHGCVP